jgi:hypothetical protein
MSTAIARTLPDAGELQIMKTMANDLSASGLLPEAYRKNPPSVFVAIQLGRELGLQPMQAITGINVIKGKPTISPVLMAALIMSSGKGTYHVKQFTDEISEIDFTRDGSTTKMTFTIEDAQKAELAHGVNWKKYPKNMLHARNMSNGARMIFPDVVQGLYTTEEIIPDVEMTEDGVPIQGQIVDLIEAEVVEEPIINDEENKELTPMIFDLIEWYKDGDFLNTLSVKKRRDYQAVLSDSEGKMVTGDTYKDADPSDLPSVLNHNNVRTWHKGIGELYDTYDLTKEAK